MKCSVISLHLITVSVNYTLRCKHTATSVLLPHIVINFYTCSWAETMMPKMKHTVGILGCLQIKC
jgi:hypothetical protein